MNPTVTGIAAAAAVIAAFVAGSMIDFDDDHISLVTPFETDGPMEKVGEALDNAARK